MAVGDVHVFPGFLTPALTQLVFQSHRLLFSHASAEVRRENTPKRKFTSTGSQTHNHQVTSLTRSPLSHPGGALDGDKSFFFDTPRVNYLFLFHTDIHQSWSFTLLWQGLAGVVSVCLSIPFWFMR